MSDLIPHNTDLAIAEEQGRQIYKTNQNYRNVAEVMEHPEFRKFYDMYMADWNSVQTVMIFMKLYETIEKRSSVPLTPYQKITFIKNVIETPELRSKIVNSIAKWSNNDIKNDANLSSSSASSNSASSNTLRIENVTNTSPICLSEHLSGTCTFENQSDAEP